MRNNGLSHFFISISLFSGLAVAEGPKKSLTLVGSPAPTPTPAATMSPSITPTKAPAESSSAGSTGASAGAISPETCPILGNEQSKIFHLPGSAFYKKTQKSKSATADHTKCFKSEDEAKKEGYRKSKT